MITYRRAELGPLLLPIAAAGLGLALTLGVASARAVGRQEHLYATLLAAAAVAVLILAAKAYLMRRQIVAAALLGGDQGETMEVRRRSASTWTDTDHHRRALVNNGRWP